MAKVTFKTDLCKGCGLCVTACPKKILSQFVLIYHPYRACMGEWEQCLSRSIGT